MTREIPPWISSEIYIEFLFNIPLEIYPENWASIPLESIPWPVLETSPRTLSKIPPGISSENLPNTPPVIPSKKKSEIPNSLKMIS